MIKPLNDRIAVKPVARNLSDVIFVNNTEAFNEGTVFAIGPKVDQVKPGDVIKYGNGEYLNWPVHEINGEKFQLIQEADVCAVIED